MIRKATAQDEPLALAIANERLAEIGLPPLPAVACVEKAEGFGGGIVCYIDDERRAICQAVVGEVYGRPQDGVRFDLWLPRDLRVSAPVAIAALRDILRQRPHLATSEVWGDLFDEVTARAMRLVLGSRLRREGSRIRTSVADGLFVLEVGDGGLRRRFIR